jgi:hypothetical protein
MTAALHRAERDGVDDEPRFDTRLDREQPTDFAKHAQHPESLRTQRLNRGFEPYAP